MMIYGFCRGGGFGHGVGLSQSGAIEMAKLGFSYKQIIESLLSKCKTKKNLRYCLNGS